LKLVNLIFLLSLVIVFYSFSVVPSGKEKVMKLLSEKKWVYEKYFIESSGTGGNMVYNRGNKINYDQSRCTAIIVFRLNGTCEEYINGNLLLHNWGFVNNDFSKFYVTQKNAPSNFSSIIKLSKRSFIWYDANNKLLGEMRAMK